ncbi:ATP-binding protein [Streptomyces himalayensis]|uniref:ATP-binding protein n=1 Tax=Streptomyces himalayensis TaxID=2820085 RepID=UPI0035A926F6
MWRNAESLLVLVGEHTPRPGTVTASGREVVQSALAEVEQYQRVVVADVEHCWVRGPVVADLAHLLAELIENALTFSPPHEPVDVHGWTDGEDYCIAVVDHGIGLSAADLERCNARLAGEEAFLVAPTRFLGHYVVGQLARRLNAEVRLFDTPAAASPRSSASRRGYWPRPRSPSSATHPRPHRVPHSTSPPYSTASAPASPGPRPDRTPHRDHHRPQLRLAHLRLRAHRRRGDRRHRSLLRWSPHGRI